MSLGWIFPDPIAVVLSVLRAAPELTGVTFGTTEPTPTVDGTPARPYGRLSVDYSYTTQRVLRVANLRLMVWAATESDALARAQKCWSVLVAYPGDANIRSIRDLTGPLPVLDPSSGSPTVTFTYAAQLRPVTP